MSNVYAQEPPTSGKVVLITSHGEIEIELWTKEAPKACKNFLQLCLEGYYDNTIFHRLIPGFMIQGGDPTGTGTGGESIYGKPFIDEFHQRLKFSHRGIVAMANKNKSNDNGSQFFMTFDQCNWLNKKHTIFGKVVGDTMFNLLAMEHLDTDSEDRPLNPPKILASKVLINPFDDIIQRNIVEKAKDEPKKEEKSAKNKEKPINLVKKNVNLLSFDDEHGSEPENREKIKIKSSHDVLQDPKLSKNPAISLEQLEKERLAKEAEENRKEELKNKIKTTKESVPEESSQMKSVLQSILINKKRKIALDPSLFKRLLAEENEENKALLEGLRKKRNKKTGKMELYWDNISDSQQSSSEEEQFSETDSDEYVDENEKKIREKQKEEYEKLKIELLQFRKEKLGTQNPEEISRQKEETKLLSNLERQRLKFIQNKRTKLHEEEVLNKLNEFRNRINSKQVAEDPDNWMNNKLRFQIDSTRAYEHFQNKEKMEEIKDDYDDGLKVVDPRKRQKPQENDDDKNQEGIKFTVDNLIKMTEQKNK